MAKTELLLPDIGTNWLDGYIDQYVILSLKLSTENFSMFLRPAGIGYTCHLLEAGRFDKLTVSRNLELFNNFVDTVAIPLTGDALHMLCIGSLVVCPDCLDKFRNREIEKPEL